PVEDPLGPKLLSPDRDLAALVVPEDHEGPRRAVPEALLEQLRVPDGPAQEVLERLARDELREALQFDPLRDRDHEIVVRHGHADVRAVGLRDREGVGAAEGVVHAPPEGKVEDHVPIPLHVDVAFEQHLPVRRKDGDQGLLLLDVRDEGLGRARVGPIFLLQPLLRGGFPVLRDLRREVPPEFADRDRQVERPREHLAGPRGDGRPAAGRVLHVDGGPAGADELVGPTAEDEDVGRAQVFDELLAQLPERGPALRVDVVRPFLRDRADVRVVDHAGPLLLPEAGLRLVEPDLREDLDVRVPRGEVVEDGEEILLRQIVERIGPPGELERLVDVPALLQGHRDHRLGEHVQRILRDLDAVDPGVVGGLREGRAFHEVHGSNAIIRPVAVSPYAWPARPILWRPLATDLGDPIWTTRSMYPMSMPSSRDVEETAALSLPSFSFCSTSRRVTFEREPWWASRSSTPRSFRRKETCSVPLRVFVKMRVVRCSSIRSLKRSYMRAFATSIGTAVMSRTGHRTARSRDLRVSTSTMCMSRTLPFEKPARNFASSSIGAIVALRPMRTKS